MDARGLAPSESPPAPGLLSRPMDWGEVLGQTEAPFALPVGTVTLLLSDIEGSTRLWEEHTDEMRSAISRYDEIVTEVVARHGGVRPRDQGEGDSFLAAFARASDALACALELQLALTQEDWGETSIRLRIALHTGDVQMRAEDNYIGRAINRCARLRAIAHGGQSLLSQSTYELVVDRLPKDVSLKDLGSHRLRDLARPEHVYQLMYPALKSDFPPLRSLDTLPNNLPLQLTSFIGRDREIEAVKKLLEQSRIVTLTGAGGSGKTRLALQVAADSLETFEGGVWFVDLASVSHEEAIADAAVGAVGQLGPTPSGPPGPPLQTLTAFFQPKHALLVLDNCEHMVEACARLAQDLVKDCPELAVIATSREPLGVDGETIWRVPSLSLPEDLGHVKLKSVAQYEAVELFIERAKRSRSDFRITEENAPAIAEITFRLDGIPLAIELAAARSRVLTPQQILEGLSDQFRLLTGRSRTALPRQQTLLASVDWSFQLLTEPERALLRRLSIFRGGCSLASAEEVCSFDGLERAQVLDILSLLVDKSLVLADESHGGFRYRLLETVRQFASDRLGETGERVKLQQRHEDHFLRWVENRYTPVSRFTFELGETIGEELANIQAASEHALENDRKEVALRLAVGIALAALLLGREAEVRGQISTLLDDDAYTPQLRAHAFVAQTWTIQANWDYVAGIELVKKAFDLFEQMSDRDSDPWYAEAHGLNCYIGAWVGGPEMSRASFDEAMRLGKLNGDAGLQAFALFSHGFATSVFGRDPQSGRAMIDQAINLVPKNTPQSAGWMWMAAIEALQGGQRGRALSIFEESIALLKRLPYKMAAVWGLDQASQISYALGDFAKSRRYVDEAMAMARRHGLMDNFFVWNLLRTTSWLQEDAGNLVGARALLDEAVDLADRSGQLILGRRVDRAPYVLALGHLQQLQGLHFDALTTFSTVLKESNFDPYQGLAGAMVYPPVGSALLSMAWSEIALGRSVVAARYMGAAEARNAQEKFELGRLAPRHEQALELLRRSINPGRLEAEWKLGASLSSQEMIAYGLGLQQSAVESSDLVRTLHISDAIDAGDSKVTDQELDEATEILSRTTDAEPPLSRCLFDQALRRHAIDSSTSEELAHKSLALFAKIADTEGVADALELIAEIAAQLESYVEAGRLLGAAFAIYDSLDHDPSKRDSKASNATVKMTRAALGEEQFKAAWEEGRSMSLKQAVSYASKGRGERKRPSSGWESLTPAELEVASLVSEGLTNPQIAERLFISRKTAQHHVSNILAKLGLTRRAGIAAEVASRKRA
jgi:predicted ATPase/class 3 adenylate cyclase/DNA-binding CsgD family transcriptional regulator